MSTAELLPELFGDDEVLVRRATVTDVEDDSGIVEARLVPYETEAQLDDDLWEVFTRGAFAAAIGNPSRVKVSNQGHDRANVLGHAVELRDEEDGFYGRLRIVETSYGRDVLALLRAGSLDELSVEFRKKTMKVSRREAGGMLVRHDKAVLVGVSPVAAGAYGRGARVLSVREALARDDFERRRESIIARLSALTSGA